MKLMKTFLIFFIFEFFSIIIITPSIFSEEKTLSEDNYRVYSVEHSEIISIERIVEDFGGYDVIFFGEEHNDSVAHYLEWLLLEKLFNTYGESLALSLEMFDRDVRVVLDEYLRDKIKEQYLKKDARIWKNYKDYRPMVEFAKEKNLDIIAANAPFRYVNLANSKGQKYLTTLSETAKSFIAPLPYDTAVGAYLEKLKDISKQIADSLAKKEKAMPDSLKKSKMKPMSMPTYNINQGQSLWDATMAYSIYQYREKNPDKKIMHVNGRMHSDDHFGVIQQLKNYDNNIRYLLISAFPEDSFPNTDFIQYKNLADYIIITDPSIPKTFEQ